MLYIVSTPIGNLKDITIRALEVLFSSDVVLCEDTRKTLGLLKEYQKPGFTFPKLVSFYEENEVLRIPEVISWLKEGKNIALVSNSGTPTISDPGFKLIRECWRNNIKVVPIPGPSAVLAALACSGLPTDKFLFLGFLPNKESRRSKLLLDLKEILGIMQTTVIFFEAPHRLVKSLKKIKEVFGEIEIVVCREITKIYEETLRNNISFFIEKFEKNKPRGELVILFSLKN